MSAEASKEDELPSKYEEEMSDEKTVPEMEPDGHAVVTQDLLKESDEVQLANDQNVEREDDDKDAADEWRDISLVTYLF